MKSLSNFPAEILAHILFGRCNSYLVVQLWKTGDRILQSKLATGIEFVDLKDTLLTSTSRYPKMLSSLCNLRYLSIDRGSYSLMPTSAALSEELRRLHGSKLKTLKLWCSDADLAFGVFPTLEGHSYDSVIFSQYPRGVSYTFDMNKYFGSLETLKVSHIEDDFLPGLPDSLTELTSPMLGLTVGGTMAKLPRSLLKLNTDLDWEFSESEVKSNVELNLEIWRDSPPMLHTIRSYLIPRGVSTFEFLPKSLTKCYLYNHEEPFTIESLASLPPLFNTISTGFQCQPDQCAQWLRALPPHTETICAAFTLTEPWLWPPALTSLEAQTTDFSNDAIAHLPRTLTNLSSCWTFSTANSPVWPPSLKHLELAVTLDGSWNIRKAAFPSGLKRLTLQSRTPIPLSEFADFPPSLELLHVRGGIQLPSSSITSIVMPQRLKILKVAVWNGSLFAILPRCLEVLFIDELLLPEKSTDIEDEALFEELPSSLLEIRFYGENSNAYHSYRMTPRISTYAHSGRFLARLTRLKWFTCAEFIVFEGTALRHLPSSLIDLSMTIQNLTEELVPFFNYRWTTAQLTIKLDRLKPSSSLISPPVSSNTDSTSTDTSQSVHHHHQDLTDSEAHALGISIVKKYAPCQSGSLEYHLAYTNSLLYPDPRAILP